MTNQNPPDFQHPKPVIYLDRNAFALITKFGKTGDPELLHFATLMDHLGKNNSIPYSDVHFFELMNTGRKSKLSKAEIEKLIDADLNIMKFISRDEIIYFDDKGVCRVTEICPKKKYNEMMLLDGFSEIYFDLLELMPKQLIRKLQKLTGLNSKNLNDKSPTEADDAIQTSMERLLELSAIEGIENDLEYKSLTIEHIEKSIRLMDKVETWLFNLVGHLMQSLPDETKKIILKALEEFKIKFQEAKDLNLKNLEDAKNGSLFKRYSTKESTEKISPEYIAEQLEKIYQDTGVSIDQDLITSVQRNLFSYHAKKLSYRNSQTSDHHDHMHARFIKHVHFFITANSKEAKSFQKRYGHLNQRCRILSADDFIQYMRDHYEIKFQSELEPNQLEPTLEEESAGNSIKTPLN